MVKLISQELSASRAPMSIVNTKKTTFRPILVLSVRRPSYIQNYWNSIFVVISKKALVSNCWIRSYDSISFVWAFCLFIVRNQDSGPWQKILLIFFMLFKYLRIMNHFSNINCCKLIDCLDNSIFCIMTYLLLAELWILFEKRLHVYIFLSNGLKKIELIVEWI